MIFRSVPLRSQEDSMVRTPPLPSFRSALVLALALASFAAPASAEEPVPGPPAAVSDVAPVRSSGATKGTIAGAVFGAIAGTMLAASLDEEPSFAQPDLLATPDMVHDVAPPSRRSGATPVLRVGVGLAVTAFGAILGRTIGTASDRRAAASRHGHAGPAIDHALRELRAVSVSTPTPGGWSCRTSTGS
jgi:hypothetical protein